MAHRVFLAQKAGATASPDRFSTILTLAFWRIRQTWLLLLLTGVSLCAMLVIACVMPLFTAVALPVGLQTLLQANATNNELTISASTQGLSSRVVSALQQQLEDQFQQTLGASHPNIGPVVVQEGSLRVISPPALVHSATFQLYATSLTDLEPHLHLVAGRWPANDTPGVIEVALVPQAAQQLHLTLGEKVQLLGEMTTDQQTLTFVDPSASITVQLVGLFNVPPAATPFLHEASFQPSTSNGETTETLLAPLPALLSTFDQLAAQAHSDVVFSDLDFQCSWQVTLQTAQLSPAQIDSLAQQLTLAQTYITNAPSSSQPLAASPPIFPYLMQASLYNPTPGSFELRDLLQRYSSRTDQISLLLTILTLQMIALLLFFVGMLVSLLLERQRAASALLNSRGASRQQLFWSLFLQGLLICLVGGVIGPIIGFGLVFLLARHLFPGGSQHVIQDVLGQPQQVLAAIAPTVGGTLLATLLTLGVIVFSTSKITTLALRRESARGTRAPFWQRFYLDVLAALIAFSGSSMSLYLASIAHEVDLTTQNLILTPLTLVAPLFLLLGFLLLSLRLFPQLLRLGSWSASRGRGASGMLALVQMARAPRPAIRMILLLSLTVAFALFAQVLNASQVQRNNTIAAYETGADFSGMLPSMLTNQPLPTIIAQYRALPGVLAASADYSDEATATNANGTTTTISFRAIDPQSFAHTVLWPGATSTTALQRQLARLARVTQPSTSVANPSGFCIPALIDQALAQQLHVGPGGIFSITLNSLSDATLFYQVAAIVPHLPTVNSSTTASLSISPGGMLVALTSFQRVYQANWQVVNAQLTDAEEPPSVPLNHLWLRTRDDALTLASVRTALTSSSFALSQLYDRRAITQELQDDPLLLAVLILLDIGSLLAFLLTFLGSLLSSWSSMRTRLRSFVVLRALGANARQIAGILLWEQGLIYLGALVLGVAFGAILTSVAVPALVFTNLPAHGPMSLLSSEDFALLQHALPPHIVIPASLLLILVALALAYLLALGIMLRMALHPTISNELRLNED